MTKTQLELMLSTSFWSRRCTDQLIYIEEIETSDRTSNRKLELQMSALEVYKYCRQNLSLCQVFDKIVDRNDIKAVNAGGLTRDVYLYPIEDLRKDLT